MNRKVQARPPRWDRQNEYYHQLFNLATVLTDKGQLCYDPGGKRSWRWGLPPMLYPTHSLGYLVGVTRERVTRISCLGWRGNRQCGPKTPGQVRVSKKVTAKSMAARNPEHNLR